MDHLNSCFEAMSSTQMQTVNFILLSTETHQYNNTLLEKWTSSLIPLSTNFRCTDFSKF